MNKKITSIVLFLETIFIFLPTATVKLQHNALSRTLYCSYPSYAFYMGFNVVGTGAPLGILLLLGLLIAVSLFVLNIVFYLKRKKIFPIVFNAFLFIVSMFVVFAAKNIWFIFEAVLTIMFIVFIIKDKDYASIEKPKQKSFICSFCITALMALSIPKCFVEYDLMINAHKGDINFSYNYSTLVVEKNGEMVSFKMNDYEHMLNVKEPYFVDVNIAFENVDAEYSYNSILPTLGNGDSVLCFHEYSKFEDSKTRIIYAYSFRKI